MSTTGPSILIFADKPFHGIYRAVSIKGERAEIHSGHYPLDRSKISGADLAMIDSGWEAKKGIRLLKAVKRINPSIMVIFLTDVRSEEMAVEAFRTGARDYLKKPVNIIALQEMIKNLLELKRRSRERRTAFIPGKSEDTRNQIAFISSFVPSWLLRVLRFIDGNLTEKISLARCAEEANLSKYHFCRQFKKYTGISLLQYLNQVRINRAKKLLEVEDMTTLEVALASGFGEYSRFFRSFKKQVGTTPLKYRKSVKAAGSAAARSSKNSR